MLLQDALHPSLTGPILGVMNFLNEVALRFPDAISFAPGRPNEKFYDAQQLTSYLDAYIRHLSQERGLTEAQIKTNLFQYGRTNGHIHDLIARMLEKDEGIKVAPESLVVTVGSQEGMFISFAPCSRRPPMSCWWACLVTSIRIHTCSGDAPALSRDWKSPSTRARRRACIM